MTVDEVTIIDAASIPHDAVVAAANALGGALGLGAATDTAQHSHSQTAVESTAFHSGREDESAKEKPDQWMTEHQNMLLPLATCLSRFAEQCHVQCDHHDTDGKRRNHFRHPQQHCKNENEERL